MLVHSYVFPGGIIGLKAGSQGIPRREESEESRSRADHLISSEQTSGRLANSTGFDEKNSSRVASYDPDESNLVASLSTREGIYAYRWIS